MFKLLIYVISLIIVVFALSGINFNPIFKKNHVFEARLFLLVLALSLTYLLANTIIDLTSINLLPNM